MSRASEDKLAALHDAVATVLTEQVTRKEAETVFDAEGNCEETGEEIYTASPATLATAIKFLKDNDITCDVDADENMGKLREVLANKTRHSRLKSGQADAKVSQLHG